MEPRGPTRRQSVMRDFSVALDSGVRGPARMTSSKNYGFEFMTYGVLVAGRHHKYGITLGQARRMAEVARSWSARVGAEVACVPSTDLSETSAWSMDGDDTDDTHYVAGLVVAAVSADDGPSRP